MDDTIKAANDLVNRITTEIRMVKGPLLKERMDLLNAAYRAAAAVADMLKVIERLDMRQ